MTVTHLSERRGFLGVRMALAAALVLSAAALPALAQSVSQLNAKLFTAVRANDMATVSSVLTGGADPNAVDANGQTPAGLAVDLGYFPIAHYILAVRNQRVAETKREEEADPRVAAALAAKTTGGFVAVAPIDRSQPEPNWRTSAAPGQPADIPTARISSPAEAVVVKPAAPAPPAARTAAKSAKETAKAKPAAPTKGATASLQSTPATAAAQAKALPPAPPPLPSGTPNPFDPGVPVLNAPPVLSTPAATPAAAETLIDPGKADSSGGAIGRFFNGITGGIFQSSRNDKPSPPTPQTVEPQALAVQAAAVAPQPAAVSAPARPPTAAAKVVSEPSRLASISPAPTPPAAQPPPTTLATPRAAARPAPLPVPDPLPAAKVEAPPLPAIKAAPKHEAIPGESLPPPPQPAPPVVDLVPAPEPEAPPAAATAVAPEAQPAEVKPAENGSFFSRIGRLFSSSSKTDTGTEAPIAPKVETAAAVVAEPPPAPAKEEAPPAKIVTAAAIGTPRNLIPAVETKVASLDPVIVPTPVAKVVDTQPFDAKTAVPANLPTVEDKELTAPPVKAEAPVPAPEPVATPAPAADTGIGHFFRTMFAKPEAPKAAEPTPIPPARPIEAPALAAPAVAARPEAVQPPAPVPVAAPAPVPAAAVQLAAVAPKTDVARPEPVAPAASSGPVRDTFVIGQTVTLDRPFKEPTPSDPSCFHKGRQPGWYCLESADWSDDIRPKMEVDSWLYSHSRTIVNYDAGKAQSIFSVFPSDNFNAVLRYLEGLYGPAQLETERFVPVVGEPAKMNATATWVRHDKSGTSSTLELRKFDNVRGMIPDAKVGFIRLSRTGATPIFRYVTESDLMLQSLKMQDSNKQR